MSDRVDLTTLPRDAHLCPKCLDELPGARRCIGSLFSAARYCARCDEPLELDARGWPIGDLVRNVTTWDGTKRPT